MSTQVQRRRGTTAESAAFTGAAGEVSIDTTLNRLIAHDGSTLGGIPHARIRDAQELVGLYGTVGGTADVITLTNTVPIIAYTAGLKIAWKQSGDNTVAMTVDVDGKGAKNIYKAASGGAVATEAADCLQGGIYEAVYDGTQFVLVSAAGSGGGGGRAFLGAYSQTSVASFDVEDFDSTYDGYEIMVRSFVPATNGAGLNAQFKMDGAYVTSAYHYALHYMLSNAATLLPQVGTGQSSMRVSANQFGNVSNDFATGIIYVQNTKSTTRPTSLRGEFDGRYYFTDHLFTCTASGFYQGTPTSHALQGIRFLANTGNIASIAMDVYGIKES